jgi:hypothetical protein
MTTPQRPAEVDRNNRLLIAVCAALLILMAVLYAVMLAGVPLYVQRVAQGDVPTLLLGGRSDVSNEIVAASAAARHLSLEAYAVYFLGLNFFIAAGFWAAAALVLWKAGRGWFRWFTALVLVFFPSGSLHQVSLVAHPEIAPYLSVGGLLWPIYLLFLYLFPDGRAVPRWSRWPMAALALAHFAAQALGFVAGLPGVEITLPIERLALIILAALAFALFCQVYRYFWGAGPVERKQIQWFVAGLAFLVIGSLISWALTSGISMTRDGGYFSDVDNVLALTVPGAITIAILRYRLWDIDVIIRRTLIYSALSAVLALAYFGSVLVLQGLFRALTGEAESPLVTVLSTLAIAALSLPLRARVQGFIDRRFYRRKVDAARTLAAFAATARDETDLERLTAQLAGVVQETMQPESMGLWLRGAARQARPGGRP